MLWLAPAQKGRLNRAHAITVGEVLEGQIGTGGAAATMWTLDECSAVSLWTPAREAEIYATSPTYITMRLEEW